MYSISKNKKEIKENLKEGKTLVFYNQDFSVELMYGYSLGGAKKYKVWFNGAFIKITKTSKPMFKEAERLINEYKLYEYEYQ